MFPLRGYDVIDWDLIYQERNRGYAMITEIDAGNVTDDLWSLWDWNED